MPSDYALLISDGRNSKYGINACLGALERLPEEEYPSILWPIKGQTLAELACEAAKTFDRLIVLWSLYSTEFLIACKRLLEFRQLTSHLAERVTHVAGGVHATAEPELTARSGFDLVATGEGEKTTLALVAALNQGVSDLSRVDGLGHYDGQLFHAPKSRQLRPLDEYPTFAMRQGRLGPIEITRGCIYACKFCQTPFMFKAHFRHRSIDSIIQHVEWQCSRGALDVRFITPTSLSYGTQTGDPDLASVEHLLKSVREALPNRGRLFFGSFPSEIRPEHASIEALTLIRRYANNDNVIIGAQSGSDRMLQASHRGHDVSSVITAVRNCQRVGLLPNVDFIFGMPNETHRDVEDSIILAKKLVDLGARIHGHTFLPLPGTPWSHEPPGVLDDAVRSTMEQLTAIGRAYGNWEAQEAQAQELAAFDSYSNRRKAQKNRQ